MRNRYILYTAIVVALAFAVGISGCTKRGTRTAMRSNAGRGQRVKPAEVLSASAFRPAPRQTVPAAPYVQQPVYAYEAAPAYSQQPAYAIASAPVVAPQPVQAPVMLATPALAMAQSREYIPAPPAAQPVRQIQPAPVIMARAPIPELEPARPYSPQTRRPSSRPVAEIMMSERSHSRQEVVRALAPVDANAAIIPVTVSSASAPARNWVASPMTAMYTGRR